MKRLLSGLFALVALCASSAEVKVDFDRETGRVKPVNGVGQPPMVGKLTSWSMMHYLKEAGIPCSRLHDVGGWLGGGMFVDIPNLFPDFDADENDPANYRFAYTDSLMKALVENDVEPFFRLGVTIENFAYYGFPPVNILPPKDYAKWARICEHVIRHYTEGWADGFRMKIKYWEIWNEPENHPVPEKNPMWRGDWESFMRFYGTVAPYLKSKFPHLKIGGYGHCGFYAGVGSDHIPAANSSPRTQYFIDCSRKFLAAARDNKWPLDFFSYHSYSEPAEALRQVRFADEHLNEFGFTADKCERIFNEWLPYVGRQNLGTALQAAGIAAELIGLQNGPCDMANIYDASCSASTYSPLFNPLTLKPHKAYYAFTAFNELRKRGAAVHAQSSGCKDLWVAAAKGGKDAAVMIANDSGKEVPLSCDFQGRVVLSCRITDKDRTDASVSMPKKLPPHSFVVAILSAAPSLVVKKGGDWLPLEYRNEIVPGSALDFSHMGFLDAPAGKYGWLRNVGGHFEFEGRPGKRVRLYGVNICSESCYPVRAEAERMVAHFKRSGYNTLRLHHHDHGMVAGSKDGLSLNAGNMDRFDYLLAAAIREGFYLTTDLYVTRALAPITWRQVGVDRDGKLGIQQFKVLCAVHEPAFRNWCAYARNFMTHINPYTKRAYKDESALALVALVNEGGLLKSWKSIGSKDERVLAAWKKWLMDKRAADPSFYPSADPNAAPKGESAVAQLFMGELEAKMVSRMKSFLRGLGCKALLSNDNWGWHYAPLQKASAQYDYIDDHFYLAHPESIGRGESPCRYDNSNPVSMNEFPPCRVGFARMVDKPFTVTEWHYCPPAMFRGTGGLLTGAFSGLQDWDGLWNFAYSMGRKDAAPYFFDLGTDPLGQIGDRAAICLFLRGDIEPLPEKGGVSLLVTPKSVKPDGENGFRAAPSWIDAAWNVRVGSCLVPPSGGMRIVPREQAENPDVKKWARSIPANPRVKFDRKRGSFTVDTPRTCGGFAPSGTIKAGVLTAVLEDASATVWASSLDGRPVSGSRRILLAHLTDLQGEGASFTDSKRAVMLNFGKGALVRNGAARISIALSNPSAYVVYGLDTSGSRLGTVPASVPGGNLTFAASVESAHGARMLYEIVRND